LPTDIRSGVRLALRLLLGAVFLYAAYTKLRQSWLLFALSVDSYQILPEWAVLITARTIPWLELILGLTLIVGLQLRAAATVATSLLGVFFAVMLFSYVRGSGIDCGCFGVGEPLSLKTLARDAALVCAGVALVVMSPGLKSARD